MRKAFIAIPCYTGSIRAETVSSVINSIFDLANHGVGVEFQTWVGDSLLPHARNVMIAKFMASDCTDLIFVDGDIAWGQDTWRALVQAPVDFAAGAYRFKNDNEHYPVRWLPNQGDLHTVDPGTGEPAENGLIEVSGVPMGFVKLARSGLERMIQHFADQTYIHESAKDMVCHLLFDLEYRDGQYWGEDYVFCRKWREAGGKIWIIDPENELGHVGTKVYSGSLGAYLRKKSEPQETMIPASKIVEVFGDEKYDKLLALAAGEAA